MMKIEYDYIPFIIVAIGIYTCISGVIVAIYALKTIFELIIGA